MLKDSLGLVIPLVAKATTLAINVLCHSQLSRQNHSTSMMDHASMLRQFAGTDLEVPLNLLSQMVPALLQNHLNHLISIVVKHPRVHQASIGLNHHQTVDLQLPAIELAMRNFKVP